jgi:hypothetical protein
MTDVQAVRQLAADRVEVERSGSTLFWGLSLWAPRRRGEITGLLGGGEPVSWWPGGRGEGGGVGPSPAADEELEKTASLYRYMYWESSIGMPGNLNCGRLGCLPCFPPNSRQFLKIVAGDHGRSRPLFPPPYLATVRESARLSLSRFAFYAQRLVPRLGLKPSGRLSLRSLSR